MNDVIVVGNLGEKCFIIVKDVLFQESILKSQIFSGH